MVDNVQMGNLVRRMNIGCDAFLGHKQVVRIARWFRVDLLGRGSRDRSLARPVVLYILYRIVSIHLGRLLRPPCLTPTSNSLGVSVLQLTRAREGDSVVPPAGAPVPLRFRWPSGPPMCWGPVSPRPAVYSRS